MAWEEDLQEAALDGIKFPMGERTVSYARDGARIRPPYVEGQDVEDTGRVPRVYQFTVPLFPDVEGYEDLYPGTYDRLVALAENPRSLTQVRYTDPVHGDLDVRIWAVQETTTPDMRDGAMLRFELEELTVDVTGASVTPRRNPSRDGEEAATEADDAIAESELTDEQEVREAMEGSGVVQTPAQRAANASGSPVESLWTGFVGAVSAGALAVDEASAAVDAVRAQVDAVLRLPAMGAAASWPIRSALLRVVEAAGRVAERAVARAVPTAEITLSGDVSVYELAASLYKDTSRVTDILRRNSVRSPHVMRRGTRVRVAIR